MKKLLVVMVALVLAVPAFAADMDLWFATTLEGPLVPHTEVIGVPGTYTLYLFADKSVATSILSIGVGLEFSGPVENAVFEINNFHYATPLGPTPAWDVVSAPGLDNLRWAAVETPGLSFTAFGGLVDVSDQLPILLGTLTADFGIGSDIFMSVGQMGMARADAGGEFGGAATVDFGGHDIQIVGDNVYNANNDLPNGHGEPVFTAVPEPTTMVLLGLGVLGVIRRRR